MYGHFVTRTLCNYSLYSRDSSHQAKSSSVSRELKNQKISTPIAFRSNSRPKPVVPARLTVNMFLHQVTVTTLGQSLDT